MISSNLSPIWYPCSQMKDYEKFPPKKVVRASGSYLELDNGHRVIDAISSWWCKSLGHGHPQLKAAVTEQMERFEHVIMANTVDDNLVKLSERLVNYFSKPYKVFYAGDGSCAVEIALKMSVHARQIIGSNKHRFVALKNAYHGETVGTLSVSDCGLYSEPYQQLFFDCKFCDVPYVSSKQDPLWDNAALAWQRTQQKLEPIADKVTAIVLEPILQGAGGMMIYSADYLKRLAQFCRDKDIHLIADEIMTGFYRTGKRFACEHAEIEPDFICIAKGLTAGFLPMSAVLIDQTIYDVFYDDYESGKSFLHSHTHSGNALCAAVALAATEVMEQPSFAEHVLQLEMTMQTQLKSIADQTGLLTNLRGLGGLVAADLVTDKPRAGYHLFQKAIELGAWLRPLGNTIYWMPPLNTPLGVVEELARVTVKTLNSCDL